MPNNNDWMPQNPCEGCKSSDNKQYNQCKLEDFIDYCNDKAEYKSNLEAITKLLEWLKAHRGDIFWFKDKHNIAQCRSLLSLEGIQSMLKQIQESEK